MTRTQVPSNKLYFKSILTDDGWVDDTLIELDSVGKISSISKSDQPESCIDYLIPGFCNTHSHSFQFEMAGLAETAISERDDSFWSWRNSMYELANSLTPDKLYEISKRLYSQMIKNGYTSVCEFHYLHDQANSNQFKIADSIVSAAKDSGILLTFVPVLYQKSDFNAPPLKKQSKFVFDSIENYLNYIEQLKIKYPNTIIGKGAHSMRAVDSTLLKELFSDSQNTPTHIHISEQQKEVDQCIEALGLRPVEWFLENIDLKANHNFVHATHMNENEIISLAKSKANVIVCPTTEANLGDGIFPYKEYLKHGGNISIGSDSHVCIDPFEELRWMEYTQRLLLQKRNILSSTKFPSIAENLIQNTQKGSRRASGRKLGLELNATLQGIVIDGKICSKGNLDKKDICSKLVFGSAKGELLKNILIGKHIYG